MSCSRFSHPILGGSTPRSVKQRRNVEGPFPSGSTPHAAQHRRRDADSGSSHCDPRCLESAPLQDPRLRRHELTQDACSSVAVVREPESSHSGCCRTPGQGDGRKGPCSPACDSFVPILSETSLVGISPRVITNISLLQCLILALHLVSLWVVFVFLQLVLVGVVVGHVGLVGCPHCVVHVVVWILWEGMTTFLGSVCRGHLGMVHGIRVWSTVRVEVRSTCKKWQGKQSHGVRVLGQGFGDHSTILCQLGMNWHRIIEGRQKKKGFGDLSKV